jgi:hypothetical protein
MLGVTLWALGRAARPRILRLAHSYPRAANPAVGPQCARVVARYKRVRSIAARCARPAQP